MIDRRNFGWAATAGALALAAVTATAFEVSHFGGDAVDLSELADGEVRVLGSGDSAVTATRDGDTVTLEMPGDDGELRTLDCPLEGASCFVVLSEDDDATRVVLKTSRVDGESILNDVEALAFVHGEGEGAMFIGEDGHKQLLEGLGGALSWIEDGADAMAKVIVRTAGGEGGLMELSGNADAIDLAEMYDGEVRTFGSGDHEITAIREGDRVEITLPDDEDGGLRELTCELGEGAGCSLMVIETDDGPAKVMLRKHVSREGEELHDVHAFAFSGAEGGQHAVFIGDGEVTVLDDLRGGDLAWVEDVDKIVEVEGADGARKVIQIRKSGGALPGGLDRESMERFDLSELADGEVRTFGDATKSLTATREGDRVDLEIIGSDGITREESCGVGGGSSCVVMVGQTEDGETVIAIQNMSRVLR